MASTMQPSLVYLQSQISTVNPFNNVPSGNFAPPPGHPVFTCTSWLDIDRTWEACEQYYANLGMEPPIYDIQPSHCKCDGCTRKPSAKKSSSSMKRSRGEYETRNERKLAEASGRKRSPKTSKLEMDAPPPVMTTKAGSSGPSGSSHSTSEMTASSESEVVTNSLNVLDESSLDTASDAADIDDRTSYCSSVASDDTETLVKRACDGLMADDFEELPESEIVKLSAGKKPNFSFEQFKSSPVLSMLPEFLARMGAANEELEVEKAAGNLDAHRLEIRENEGESSSGQYIEMNLGLGVLEEKNEISSSSSSEDTDSDGSGQGVMQKLLGVKGATDDATKPKIEEV
ncbi:MAG: hypothetical protein M1818_003452 [Claussenomyces sp. TS43310]|nr:MAG: hypothetical protein M1818_003452 [Claussenomyces sp. TS43310]